METVVRLLTQKRLNSAHTETELTINWDGVTHEQLQLMAQFYIQTRVQCEIKHAEGEMPKKFKVDAVKYVQPEPVKERNLTARQKKALNVDKFTELTKGMSAEEIQLLLALAAQ